MNTEVNPLVRKLPLSHLVYKDDEVDRALAEKLVVYHYPLPKSSYRWKEWEGLLDHTLSNKQYPYLMRSYNGQFGLFVAVDQKEDQPPYIVNADNQRIHPQRIYYAPSLNPVWIRLIMRKLVAFGNHCKGSHTLGRPLLKVDVWKTKKSTGINAISLDCRTQQLRDGNTTEIVLFYENIPLRPLSEDYESQKIRKSLWVYAEKKVLVRWIPKNGEKPTSPVYCEISKDKNKRKTRPFIDLANEQKFNTSWPNLILPVQREFIKCAAGYGFVLRPKVLNLQRLENKTKYKTTSDKNRTGSVFSSLSLDKEVSVLDLRVNKTVTTGQIIDKLNAFLQKSMIEASFRVIVGFDENNLDDLSLDRNDQLLILLDQRPKVPGDRYPLTSVFKGKVASQHLNVNPYDLTDEDELENLSLGTEEKPSPAYYLYDFDDFDREGVESNLKRNAEVVIKELHLKHLIISPKARISKSLSNEKELLTEHLTVITDGYLFTVRNDRPVILPFNPSDKSALNLCDSVLKNHRISSIGLLALLKDKWPYSYRPEVVMQQFGTPSEKQTRFAKRLTFVLLGESTILLQDPKYDRPHMLPEGMEEVTQTLRQQGAKLPLQEWKLPTLNEIIKRIDLLTKNKEFTAENQKKLNASLGDLTNFWEEGRQQLADDEKYEARLKDMVNAFNNSYKKHLRRELGLSDDQHPRGDTQLRSLWMTLLSALYKRSMTDPRRWLRDVPGINAIWHDPEQSYYVVGQLASAQKKLSRQPSIRQWHALKGQVDTELLASLIDVDWVRMNQLAGNPCVATLIRKWQECQPEPGAALIPQKNKPLSVTDLKEEYSVSI